MLGYRKDSQLRLSESGLISQHLAEVIVIPLYKGLNFESVLLGLAGREPRHVPVWVKVRVVIKAHGHRPIVHDTED